VCGGEPKLRLLFDENMPRPLCRELGGHSVSTVQEMGWAGRRNGDLLRTAEQEGFEVLITCDRGIPYQQNLGGRSISVIALVAPANTLEALAPLVPDLLTLLATVTEGSFYELRR
jgi:hypothetical protein